MAGTLTISTLSDGTNSTSATNCIRGSAKAWVYFTSASGVGAATIAGSFNVSSVTYVSSGRYTITFTTAMTDANYALSGVGNVSGFAYWGGTKSAASFDTAFGTQSYADITVFR